MSSSTKSKWSKEDRQRFSDKNVLRAKTVPAKRKPEPTAKEWDK